MTYDSEEIFMLKQKMKKTHEMLHFTFDERRQKFKNINSRSIYKAN